MNNKRAIYIFFILCTFFFTTNVHAVREDGQIRVYNACANKRHLPSILYHITPLSEGCSRLDIPIQYEQVFPIPVINQSTSGVACQYDLGYEADGIVSERFGPFTPDPDKIIVCRPTPPPAGPCKCGYSGQRQNG